MRFCLFVWHLPPHLCRGGCYKQAAPGLPCNSSGRVVKEMGGINWRMVWGGQDKPAPYPVGFTVGPWRLKLAANAVCFIERMLALKP